MKYAHWVFELGMLLMVAFVSKPIDSSSFYKALSGGDEAAIDKMIEKLDGEKDSPKNNAYIGTLTMKKAGFMKGVKGKVRTFKQGAGQLEEAIAANPANTEFRFLRLSVQEHAPDILKYNKQISEDKAAVVAGYSKLDKELKKIVDDYAKDSKVLKPTDLNK